MGASQEDSQRLLHLLTTAGDPTSSDLSADELAKALGIEDLPTKDEALATLEEKVLAPVKDLSGPNLHQWQM
jgi:hypothetical protein